MYPSDVIDEAWDFVAPCLIQMTWSTLQHRPDGREVVYGLR
jgi:hypothetical protein